MSHRTNSDTVRAKRWDLYKKFHSLESAWGYFQFAVERDGINPPAESGADNAIDKNMVGVSVE